MFYLLFERLWYPSSLEFVQCSCVLLPLDARLSTFLKPTSFWVMWASVVPLGSFWHHQYFMVCHSLHGLECFLSSSQPDKTVVYGADRGWGGWGWLGSSEIEAQEQASKHSLGWMFWTPRSRQEHFGSWSWNFMKGILCDSGGTSMFLTLRKSNMFLNL